MMSCQEYMRRDDHEEFRVVGLHQVGFGRGIWDSARQQPLTTACAVHTNDAGGRGTSDAGRTDEKVVFSFAAF